MSRTALGEAVSRVLGAAVTAMRPQSGGDINDAYQVELADGRSVFVKTHSGGGEIAPGEMFACEARGLAWLAEAGAVRVPAVVAVAGARGDGRAEPAFLALEMIAPGRRAPNYDDELGRGLAALHRAGAPGFGLEYDNFIATLPQCNETAENWPEFYAAQRLEPMVRRAVSRGVAPASWARDFDALHAALPRRCGPEEPPARLHGDLWGGNLHVDAAGQPCLIDPAVYGGHREIDLAMLDLFGGVGPRFWAAYDEAYPLAPGRDERVGLYQLYPLLVHVNLFGASYVAAVERALRRYL